VDAVQLANGDVHVTWQVTGDDPALTGFEVTRTASGAPVSVATTGTAAREATDPLSGVSTGEHFYTYTVIAHAGAATIDSMSVTTSVIYKDLPSSPVDINIDTLGPQVTLHWQPPAVNRALLLNYRIQRRIDSGAAETDPASPLAPSPAPTLVETLKLDTGPHDVEYTISSIASGGTGGRIQFTVSLFVNVPGPPATVTARMGFDGVDGVVGWTAPTQNPNLVTGYRVVRTVAGTDTDLGTVAAGVHQFVDSGVGPLPNGTDATYTVTALAGSAHGGADSANLTVNHTVLAFPTAPTVTAKQSALLATWPAPATGGVAVTTYRLQYRLGDPSGWLDVPSGQVNSTKRRATITGLNDCTAYDVRVAALDPAGAGMSAWSPSGHGTPDGNSCLASTGGKTLPIVTVGLTLLASGAALYILAGRRRRWIW
jgi:hypothetical protein